MKSVLIGLSGGVDSAVSALLLKKQGYRVIGAFMKNFSENKNLKGECHWVEDKKDAEKIAALLEIPMITLSFENDYQRDVINPMFRAYKKGLTPNPDANCNRHIKFPLLWKEAQKRGIDYIATGHYARIIKNGNEYELHKSKDTEKDQTYFLYTLKEKDLEHTLFPIGNYTKKQVRAIAKKNKIPVYDKRGSRGICFVGKMDMKTFLKQEISEKQGKIIDAHGITIGHHIGSSFYTIGERLGQHNGAIISSKAHSNTKLYVAEKNRNDIIVVPKENPKLYRTEFKVKNLNLLDRLPNRVLVRIRHRGELIPARIKKNRVFLDKPSIIAPGQSAVFYLQSKVIGGGEIS